MVIEQLTSLGYGIFPSNKAHARFHRQIKQFGMTQPRRTEIKKLKEFMELERKHNIKEVIL